MNRFAVLLLLVPTLLWPPGARALDDDTLEIYVEGLRARDFENWREAVQLFAAAVRREPEEGEWVRPYGTWLEHYMPHYYLGEALFEAGSFRAALSEWELSETDGVLRVERNRGKLEHVETERRRLDEEILPSLRKDLLAELGQARAALEELGQADDTATEADRERRRTVGANLDRATEALGRSEADDLLGATEEARFLLDEAWSDLALSRELVLRRREGARSGEPPVRLRSVAVTPDEPYSRSYALVVGVSDYRSWEDLPGVPEDVDAVERALVARGFEVEVVRDPTRKELASELERFVRRRGREPGHRLVFFYAGHGWSESAYGVRLGYLVPADGGDPRGDPVNLAGFLSMDVLARLARELEARHVLFAFDSCFSGTIFHAARARAMGPEGAAGATSFGLDRPARLFLTAGDARERVPDESLFKASLLEGLGGSADLDLDGWIAGRELGAFVREHGVTPYSSPQWGFLEDPRLRGGDIVFRRPASAGGSSAGE